MTPMTTGTDFPTQPRMHTDQIHATPIRSPTSPQLELNGTSILRMAASTIIKAILRHRPRYLLHPVLRDSRHDGSPLSLMQRHSRALVSFDETNFCLFHSGKGHRRATRPREQLHNNLNQVGVDGWNRGSLRFGRRRGGFRRQRDRLRFDPMDFNSVANVASITG